MSKNVTIPLSDQKEFNFNLVLTKQFNLIKPEEAMLSVQLNHFPIAAEVKQGSKKPKSESLIIITDKSGSMRDMVGDWDEITQTIINERPSENDGIFTSINAIVQIINNQSLSGEEKFINGIMFSEVAEIFLDNEPFSSSTPVKLRLSKLVKENKSFNEKNNGTDFHMAFSTIKAEWLKKDLIKIFLLTDGEAKVNHDKIFKELAAKAGISVAEFYKKCAIYVFGIGKNYKVDALQPFADRTRGRLFRVNTNAEIPQFLNTLAENTIAHSPKVYAKLCTVKVDGNIKKHLHFEPLMQGLDKQVHSFSLPVEMFTQNASLHLQLTNGQSIVYEDLSLLPTNGADGDINQFIIYCGRSLAEITDSKILSRHQKISELQLLAFGLKKLINGFKGPLKSPEFISIQTVYQNTELCLTQLDKSREGKLSADAQELTKSTGFILLYSALSDLQKKMLTQEQKNTQKTPKSGMDDPEYGWIDTVESFEVTRLPVRNLTMSKGGVNRFAYSEAAETSPEDKENRLPKRLLVGIDRSDPVIAQFFRTAFEKSTDFPHLIKWVNEFFGPLDEETPKRIKKMIYDRQQACPKEKMTITLKFSDFIKAKIADATQRAFILAVLHGIVKGHSDEKLGAEQNNIRIYQRFSFTGQVHAVVLFNEGDQIFIGDPVYNQFFEVKKTLSGRTAALDFYKEQNLDGFLFKLCVENNWHYDELTQVPLMPELTVNEEEACGEDGYNLLCPLSATVLQQPVYLFSKAKAEEDAKNPNIPERRRGLLSYSAFERSMIEPYANVHRKNPMTNLVLPPDWKLIPAIEKAQEVWYFITEGVLKNRPDALSVPVDESKQSARRQKNFLKSQAKLSQSSVKEPSVIYYIRNNELVIVSSSASSSSSSSSSSSFSSSSSSSFNSSSGSGSTSTNSGIFSFLASWFNSSPVESKRTTVPKEMDSNSPIKMYRSRNGEIALEFESPQAREIFTEQCGYTFVPKQYREREMTGQSKYNSSWQTPACYADNNKVCYLPYSLIQQGKVFTVFEDGQVLRKLVNLLCLAKDKDIVDKAGVKIAEAYGSGLFEMRIVDKVGGIMHFPSTSSHILQKGAYVVFNRIEGTITLGIYKPQIEREQKLSTSSQSTFASSSLSSSSSSSSTSQSSASSTTSPSSLTSNSWG